MKKTIVILFIATIQFQIIAQDTQAYNDLELAYNYCKTVNNNISSGLNAVYNCYSLSNASQLRTQILFATSYPAESKTIIDNAINQIYKVERRLRSLDCPMAIRYSEYTRELLDYSRSDLQSGGLALINASKQRYTNNIHSQMRIGASHLKKCLSNLKNAFEMLNKIVDEMNSCRRSSPDNTSSSISCSSLIEFIEDEGIYEGTIRSYTLNSSWIKEVSHYEYENNIYVVASIYETENGYKTNKYIFCSIPESNWSSFKYGNYGTYGERFHEYIFNYKCECD